MKTIQELILAAGEKCAAELSRRRDENLVERHQLDGANEGIDFFIRTLVEEIKNVGKDVECDQVQRPQPEGQASASE